MSPPRLTGALRSFSTVSKQEDFTLELYDLKAKRLKRQELFAREGLTWPKVAQLFTQHQEKKEQQSASQELKNILQAAKQIVGTEFGQDTIESAAVFLFKTFHNKDQVGHEETRAIKQMFGPFPASAAEASCVAVGRLVALLGESHVEAFIQTQSSSKTVGHGATFGRNITFSFDSYVLDTQDALPWEEEQGEGRSLDFNSFLNNHVGGRRTEVETVGASSVSALSQSSAESSILRREVEKYLSGGNMGSSSAEELCTSLFEMLSSTKSDDELQNELFEFLGPEGFEMISVLLQRRSDIVDSLLSGPPDNKLSYPPDGILKSTETVKPTYGCQVTIQSEQERQMMKLYRREEKRERKREKRSDDGEYSEATFHFDPKELRLQREQALLTARRSPVLGRQREYERPRYPHVYDSYAEATKTSAFIGGAKMLLPEGIQRENNKMFEQVEIPPNEPMPIGFQEKPVYISDLDEIGQLVFKGMKRLNRIQSIVFETGYNTNENMLVCAPTGAGKTNIAMLTVLHEIRQHLQPGGVIRKDQFKIVYVAPMKALAAEMTNYFSKRLEPLGITVKELTGDMQLTKGEILRTQMLVTTPEKWDVVTRKSVGDVGLSQIVRLLILDEVHLLHEDRGPVLESLVARTLRQVESTQSMIRILGLSATLPNYLDVASFLHVNPYIGLFFFDSRFRPVPLGQTFVGIKTTNKIQQLHDMEEVCYDKVLEQIKAGHQVMVFVHARNSTVRTAMSLIEMAKNRGESSFFQPDQGPDYGHCEKQWLHQDEREMTDIIATVRDSNLKLTLAFGIGMHHAGLHERDRKTVEELFVNCKIQVLIATSTLAWGVNFPAHLVIVKGTEYYDGKTHRYVDYPITDVLQMMGRAGRPQFDDQGKAVILVHDIKKDFYKKFLYEPFPVESSLLGVLSDHLNAEIAAGTITSKQDAMDYITWTYFFRRLVMNPSYYNLDDTSHETINKFLSNLVERSLRDLECSYCMEIQEDERTIEPLTYGRIASYYYLKHQTVRMFKERLKPELPVHELLTILTDAEEYAELPVRHNEDQLNSELAQRLPLQVNPHSYDSAHTKTHLLLQAHFSRAQVPCSDYITDTKTVLDNAIRICQAMLDVAANEGWLVSALSICNLVQMIVQARWLHDSSLLTLPHIEQRNLYLFRRWSSRGGQGGGRGYQGPIEVLPELMAACEGREEIFTAMVREELQPQQISQAWVFLTHLPVVEVSLSVKGWWEGCEEQTERALSTGITNIREQSSWLPVHADQEYVLQVSLQRLNMGQQRRRQDTRAHAPRFPKPKDEGWFLVLGEVEKKELLAVKRVGYIRNRSVASVAFFTPEQTRKCIYTLYLMSDSYLGLDQQYDIHLNVIPASISAQVNTEVSDSMNSMSFK
ncbi:hypothetical protein MHYP_G00024530 [Metynnis hypsauchen]